MNRETEADRANELAVAAVFGRHLGCVVHSFGNFSPVDWWLTRNQRMYALAELKCRNLASDCSSGVVFLSLRKWIDLQRFSYCFSLPSFFVVRFTDEIRYIDVREVGSVLGIAINKRLSTPHEIVSSNDTEPGVQVPIRLMQRIAP